MDREELIELIKNNTVDSAEATEILGISRQRLSDMNRTGKLVAIKKGIYLKQDVIARKEEQGELRIKYNKK